MIEISKRRHRRKAIMVKSSVKNEGLAKARDAKKDEFYTAYEDIQAEMNHYEDKFQGKTVLCNCDDPFESNFCKFFLRNFNYLGLKRLICTSYSTSPFIGQQLTLFDCADEPVVRGNGYVMDVKEVPMANGRGVSDEDINALLKSKKRGVKKLKGDGDFRSEECRDYLKQADVVVTNPPFSLFREYVAQLVAHQKDFLIIGNVNAITYKDIFPLIKDNKLWLGASIHSGDRKFYVPNDYPLRAAGCGMDEDGRRYIRVKGVRWFTNLDYAMRHEDLVLYKRYYGNEEEYPKYDNYDAINVDKTSDIPCDYFENLGVPLTYLDKYNPSQFEIVGSSRDLGQPMSNIAPKGSYESGGPSFYLAVDKFGDTADNLNGTERNGTERNGTERNGTEVSSIVLQSGHQAQVVMAYWESRLPSSTSTAPINLRLSDLLPEIFGDLRELPQARERMDRILTASCAMEEFLSNGKCNGIMGVPITFLDKYNPEQFEILGITLGNTVDYPMTTLYQEGVQHNRNGETQGGGKVNTRAAILVKEKPVGKVYYTAKNTDGYLLSIYPRILIRRIRR